jgi:predicted oxidoreductase
MTVSRISLAQSNASLSRIVVGFWRLSDAKQRPSADAIYQFLEACFDRGITTFDHADIYGDYSCEEIFGQVLLQNPALRSRMELISKCGIKLISPNRPQHHVKSYDTSQAHITQSVHNSLQKLHTDYLDMLLIHRPDPLLNADEVAETFMTLKKAGKVLHFGVSNFTTQQFNLLQSRLDFPLQTNQIEFSVLHMQALTNGTLDQCQQLRISPMAWSPFGGGRLFREENSQTARLLGQLATIGQELGGASVDQVALAWILKHPANIIPVLGSGQIQRIQEATEAEKLSLSREQWFRIWEASTGHEVA